MIIVYIVSNPYHGGMRETYHHGNLHAELIRLGELEIATRGLNAFGLREVARKAGVSIGAVFRHVKNKDDLVRGVALAGFQALHANLQQGDDLDASSKLLHGFQTYLTFATSRPGCLRAMFGGILERSPPESEVVVWSARAFDWLVGAVRSGQIEGWLDPQPAENTALVLFSALHGAAILHLEMGAFPVLGRLGPNELADLLWRSHVRALRISGEV